MTKFGKYLACGVAAAVLASGGVAAAKIDVERDDAGAMRLTADLYQTPDTLLPNAAIEDNDYFDTDGPVMNEGYPAPGHVGRLALNGDDTPIFDEEYVADRVIVFFEPGSASLTPEAMETLSMFANFVENTGYTGLVVKGHTDGEEMANGGADLSHRRAMTVLTALVDSGLRVDEHKRLTVVVDGEPDGVNGTAIDRDELMGAAERRVDVIVRHDTPPYPVTDASPVLNR